jgi:hypothetical protein
MRWRAPVVAVAAVLSACVSGDTVAVAGSPDALRCATAGPRLSDGGCTARLASALFSRALCGCRRLDFSPALVTDGFDSRVGPWAPGGGDAPVGGNDGLIMPGALDVGGDLTLAGSGLLAGTRLAVGGDLTVAGGLGRSSSVVSVAGSAHIGGDVVVASLDVSATLTQPAGATSSGDITAGARQVADVVVSPPCPCGAAGGIDVRAVIAGHQAVNDDAAIALSPTAYSSLNVDQTLTLPCGTFYLEGLAGSGTLTVVATGRAALSVRGSVPRLKVQLEPGAELDLFIEGPLGFAPGELGDPTRPSALRLYATSGADLDLTPLAPFSGLLYAPDLSVTSGVATEVFGALVVANVNGGWGGLLAIHHDRAARSLGEACP